MVNHTAIGGYTQQFPGYCADHYRVLLKDATFNSQSVNLARTRIEIQIMTVLRHAWAEIEHDMVYKEIRKTTNEEHQTLDGLSGAIFLREYFLDRLCETQVAKPALDEKPFETVYDLGGFLREWVAPLKHQPEHLMQVELLRDFLTATELNTPKRLREVLKDCDLSMDDKSDYRCFEARLHPARSNITTYLMDHILSIPAVRGKLKDPSIATLENNDEPRYQLEIITSALLWLDRVYRLTSDLLKALFPNDSWDVHLAGIKWLDSRKPKDYYKGDAIADKEDREILQNLFSCFEQSNESLVQLAFALAQLGVLRAYAVDCSALHRVLAPLLTVINIRY